MQSKTKVKAQVNQKTNWGLWIMISLVVFSIFYLIEINSMTTKGYEIKKFEKRITALKESEKKLELEAASLQSIQVIEESAQVLNLVPSAGMNYPSQNGYAYEDILAPVTNPAPILE